MSHLTWLVHPVDFVAHLFQFGSSPSAAARDVTQASAGASNADRSLSIAAARGGLMSETLYDGDGSSSGRPLLQEMVMDLP